MKKKATRKSENKLRVQIERECVCVCLLEGPRAVPPHPSRSCRRVICLFLHGAAAAAARSGAALCPRGGHVNTKSALNRNNARCRLHSHTRRCRLPGQYLHAGTRRPASAAVRRWSAAGPGRPAPSVEELVGPARPAHGSIDTDNWPSCRLRPLPPGHVL